MARASFTLHCSSSLSCVNVYLTIDSGGYIYIYCGHHISTKCRTRPARHLAYSKEHCHAATPQVRQTVCEVLVRPTLEFDACAWAPHTKTGIQTFITGDYRRTSCVSDMCTNLMGNSLYTRRRIRDATMCFFNSPRTAHQFACHHHHSRRQHKLRTLPATCTPYQQSFYARCIPLWNALTEEAVIESTAEVFQRAAIPVIQSLTL